MTQSQLPWDIPSSWSPALEAARAGASLFLLGAVDSGKSTLAAVLASAAAEAGRVAAVVDADLGQSSLGPPTCVGMARVPRPVASLDELQAEAIDFVGCSSPVGHLLAAASGVHALARSARDLGAETLIVDTTGLIAAGVGRALKSAKIRLLDPDFLVALQADDEVEHLLSPFAHRHRPRLLRLRPSRRVKPRTRDQRAARRQHKFAAYFASGRPVEVPWDAVPIENSAWTSGEPAPGHLRAYAEERLACEVLHAEVRADGLLLIISGRPDPAALRALGPSFGGSARAIQAETLANLLVGLLGGRGETLALAVLESVDFRSRRLRLFTPLDDIARATGLRLGSLRVARDGAELGWIEPGELA